MANINRRWRASTQIHAPNPFTTTSLEQKDSKEKKGQEPNALVQLLHGAIEKDNLETIKSIFQVQPVQPRRRSLAFTPSAATTTMTNNSSSPTSGGSSTVKDDDIIEWLSYPDLQGQTAFHVCAGHGTVECFQLLFDFATFFGQSPVAQKRINTLLSATDGNGWTPLHTACVSGNLLLCQKIISLYPTPTRKFKSKLSQSSKSQPTNKSTGSTPSNGIDIANSVNINNNNNNNTLKNSNDKNGNNNNSNNSGIITINNQGNVTVNVKQERSNSFDKLLSLRRSNNNNNNNNNNEDNKEKEENKENTLDINKKNKSGSSALHYLVRNKCTSKENKVLFKKIMREMVMKGAEIEITNLSGETPLHHACFHDRLTSVKWLVKRGSDINYVNKSGETPLHFASRRGSKKIVKFLLEKGSDFCIVGDFGSAAEVASNGNHPEIVSLFYQHAKSKRSRSRSNASNNNKINDEDLIKELQYLAELGDYPSFLDILEEKKTLLDATDEFGKTLLMVACYHGNWQIVNYLIEQGAKVTSKDKEEWQPIHYAACSTNENVLNLIIQNKEVDVNVVNKDNNTVLHYLAKNKHITRTMVPIILGILNQKGLNFNAQNKNGETALHNGSWHGSVTIVRQLLLYKVDVDIVNKYGETPLIWSVRMSHFEVAKLLVNAGCNQSIKGRDGTALDIAYKLDTDDSLNLIKLLGGNPDEHHSNNNNISIITTNNNNSNNNNNNNNGEVKKVKDSKGLFQKILKNKGNQKAPLSTVHIIQFQEDPKVFRWIIKEEEIDIGPHLGSGKFGSVFSGVYRGQKVAVKVLDNITQREVVLKEFEIMSSMRSPHVVYFYGMVTKPSICLVMQYCQKGSLASVLRNREFQLDWSLLFRWMKKIVQGVADCHNWLPKIVHRDLKPDNILVDESDNVYISDFGMSRFINEHNLSTLNKLRGTYAYCSPEIYFGEQATTKSDCYSLGIILWELVSKCLTGNYVRPYKEFPNLVLDFQIIVQVAKSNLRPTIHADCPPGVASLITKCWSPSPTQRPSALEILDSLEELKQQYLQNPKQWKTNVQLRDLELSPSIQSLITQEKVISDLYVKTLNSKLSKPTFSLTNINAEYLKSSEEDEQNKQTNVNKVDSKSNIDDKVEIKSSYEEASKLDDLSEKSIESDNEDVSDIENND